MLAFSLDRSAFTLAGRVETFGSWSEFCILLVFVGLVIESRQELRELREAFSWSRLVATTAVLLITLGVGGEWVFHRLSSPIEDALRAAMIKELERLSDEVEQLKQAAASQPRPDSGTAAPADPTPKPKK
jgi:hypothetical protein